MKPWISVSVFLFLMLSSLLSSIGSYKFTEELIAADLSKALSDTLTLKRHAWLTNDSIKAYRQLAQGQNPTACLLVESSEFRNNIRLKQLQDKAFLAISVLTEQDAAPSHKVPGGTSRICGDTIILHPGQDLSLAFSGLAECSMLTVFFLSDQRIPMALAMSSMLWLAFIYFYNRKRTHYKPLHPVVCVGNMAFHPETGTFSTPQQERVAFTPMQERLMLMFFNAAQHTLDKNDICQHLWPRKPDANDTLYTLVKRLKTVLHDNSNLDICAQRGKSYQLTEAQREK